MSQTSSVPPIVTRGMKFVLRMPIHGMVSKTTLLISFTGRKKQEDLYNPGKLFSICRPGLRIYPPNLVEKPGRRRGPCNVCGRGTLSQPPKNKLKVLFEWARDGKRRALMEFLLREQHG